MKIFQATLVGYDGSTDETDHLIKWIKADSLQDAELCCARRGWQLKELIIETTLDPNCSEADAIYASSKEPGVCPVCGFSSITLNTKDAFITHEYVDIPASCPRCSEELRVLYNFALTEVD